MTVVSYRAACPGCGDECWWRSYPQFHWHSSPAITEVQCRNPHCPGIARSRQADLAEAR